MKPRQSTSIPKHPVVPRAEATKLYKAVALKATPHKGAKTARQKEIEKKTGRTYDWRTDLSKTFWARPAVYSDHDKMRASVFDAALTDGLGRNLPTANLIAGALSADADKKARTLSQAANNVEAIEHLVKSAGLSTDVLRYTLTARARSAGYVSTMQRKSRVTYCEPMQGLQFTASLQLAKTLPKYRKALLALGFKKQADLVNRPGFLAGVFYYDGSASWATTKKGVRRVRSLNLVVDTDAVTKMARILGKPDIMIKAGPTVTSCTWHRKASMGKMARALHQGVDGAVTYMNPRKVEAIQYAITNY